MSGNIIVFDTETNSPNPREARLVTAYLGLMNPEGEILTEREWLIRPDGYVITEETTAIHGVSHEHALENGVPVADFFREFIHILTTENGTPIAGQNLPYDLTVMDNEFRRLYGKDGAAILDLLRGRPVLDSLVIDKHLYKFRRGNRNLITLAEVYGIPFTEEEAHNADFDAKTAGRIILKQLRTLGSPDLHQLHEMQGHWRKSQQESLQKWLRANKDKDAVCETDWPLLPHSTEEEAA